MAPIKGLTDRKRLPRLGKIHLGVKAESPKTGKEYPTATDYFVCPEEFLDVYGAEPRELDIIFPIEDEDQFASTYYRRYSNVRGLMCKGDGEIANRKVDIASIVGPDGELPGSLDQQYWPIAGHGVSPDDIQMRQVNCAGQECPEFKSKACKQMMMLQFMCPKIPGLGIYQLDTTSFNSVDNIYGGIELIRMGPQARIAGVPLKLRLIPMQVTPKDTALIKTIYVLSLHYDFKLQSIFALPSSNDLTALPEPDDEVPTDLIAADVEDVAPVSAPESVMAPPRPAPAPNPNPRRAKTQKPDPAAATAYGVEMWKMTNKELTEKLQSRRLDLGVTPEALQEKATEIGLDDYRVMKPNQFTTLMDWMAAEFGEAQPVPEVPGQEITAGDERYGEQAAFDAEGLTSEQGTANPVVGASVGQQGAAQESQEDQGTPEQVDSGELTREQRMAAITDDYTWEQTLSLASEFGVLTRKAFESRILRVSQQEWEELYDGTAATAARRLILTMMLAADGVVE